MLLGLDDEYSQVNITGSVRAGFTSGNSTEDLEQAIACIVCWVFVSQSPEHPSGFLPAVGG